VSSGATLSINPRIFFIPLLEPRISPSTSSVFLISIFSVSSFTCSTALRTLIRSLSLSIGFSIKSKAPSLVALIAFSTLPCAEIIITEREGVASLTFFRTSSRSFLAFEYQEANRISVFPQ